MAVFVRFQGLSEATGTLRGLPEHLERRVIAQMSQIAYDEAQRGAASHTRPETSGALFQSLFNRAIPKGREIGHDLDRAPHAVFVQFGTRPHEIRPREKKALRWVSGNGFVFAGKVNHPGYSGDAYLINAATLAVRQFASALDAALKEAP